MLTACWWSWIRPLISLKTCVKTKSLRIAYIVTDDERRFQALARRLPEGVEAIRLYESYLTNFAFANGDDA